MIETIAHRGNTRGRVTHKENAPEHILDAARNHYVELDVWYCYGEFYLGHDEPVHLVDEKFLMNPKFFCHAKNVEALHRMAIKGIHCFLARK